MDSASGRLVQIGSVCMQTKAVLRWCLMWNPRLPWVMAKCPYCDYEGRVDSVEAHISGKCDEAHKGKVGQGFRESLPQLPDGDQSEPDAPDDPDDEPPDDPDEPPSISSGYNNSADDVAGAGSGEVAAVGAATAATAVPAVLGREISPVALALIGVALIVVVGFLLLADPDEPDDDPEPVPSTDANADFAGAFEQ